MKRKVFAAALALSITFLTAGCMKLNLAFTVDENDQVSGTMIMAFSKDAIAQAEAMGMGDQLDVNKMFEGLTKDAGNVEPYEDDNFTGSQYTIEPVDIADFSQSATAETLTLKREGDLIIASGVLDTLGQADPAGFEQAMQDPTTAAMIEQSDISISLTLPGKVTSTNGTVSGNTVTFSGKMGDKITIDAKADTSTGASSSAGDMTPYIGIFVAVAIGAVAGILIRKRRMAAKATAEETPEDQA